MNREIKELKKILFDETENYCDSDGCIISEKLAEVLANKGYQKISSDQVVISKDALLLLEANYDKVYAEAEGNLRAEIADGGTSCQWCGDQYKKEGYDAGVKFILTDILLKIHSKSESEGYVSESFGQYVCDLAKDYQLDLAAIEEKSLSTDKSAKDFGGVAIPVSGEGDIKHIC